MLEIQGLAYLYMAKFQSNLRRKNIDFLHQNAYKIGFLVLLEFTPLEFETSIIFVFKILQSHQNLLRWSLKRGKQQGKRRASISLEFTPLEFETISRQHFKLPTTNQNLLRWSLKQYSPLSLSSNISPLEFTPLEFETGCKMHYVALIYLLLEFTPLEFETQCVEKQRK